MLSDIQLDAQEGEVTLACATVKIAICPLLTFHTRSPDRFWPLNQKRQTVRNLDFQNAAENGMCLLYRGSEPARLQIFHRNVGDPLRLEAWTYLPEPVYSHLNDYCRITIQGYRRLSLCFSPIPNKMIELHSHAFPSYWVDGDGFGYVGRDGQFHWARGAWEEKGPYSEEASGSIRPDEPLEMTVFDDGKPICRITLEDWTAQLSLDLSPTAGWGIPANAIVPFVGPMGCGSEINFQLAASHIGWGKDSVGHNPGAYRNRITVEPLIASEGR